MTVHTFVAPTEAVGRRFINHALDESVATRRQKRVWALAAGGIGLDGYDLFIMSAALPLVQAYFGNHSSLMAGWLAGAAVLGAVPGALISGVLADRFGRRTILQLDVVLFVLTSLLCAIAWSPLSLIFFRFWQGFAVGAEYPISASIVVETMPRPRRGRWVTGAFMFQAVGMVAAAAVATLLLLILDSESAWRWMLLSGAVPAGIVALMRRSLPESPRWLARRGRMAEAEEALVWLLGRETVDRQRQRQRMAQKGWAPEREPREGRVRELFRPAFRARTSLTTIPWFIMDIGLYGIGLFTPVLLATLIVSKGHSGFLTQDLKATAAATVADIFLVIGFVINLYAVDRVGRIQLQIIGFIGMAIGMLVVALSGDQSTTSFVIAGFIIFNLTVNLGPNATTYLLPAEVYPTRLRSTGHGFAAACGKGGATLGTFLLPAATSHFGTGRTMIVIGISCLVGAVITLVFRVDTRGRALAD